MTRSLSESLNAWTDRDVAMFRLAVALGILEETASFAKDLKHVFWTENRLGASLEQIIQVLVGLGALELDAEEEHVRWNESFDWKGAAQ